MKTNVIIASILISMTFSSVRGQKQVIEFQINNLYDTKLYFGAYYGQNKYLIDSIIVSEGHFVVDKTEAIVAGMYFLQSENFFMDLIIAENEPIVKVEMDNKLGMGSTRFTGSIENRLLMDFKLGIMKIGEESKNIFRNYQQAQTKDSVGLFSDFEKIRLKERKMRESIYRSHPTSLATAIIKISETVEPLERKGSLNQEKYRVKQYWHIRNNYFVKTDLNNPLLLRTPYLHNKVMKYFEDIIPQKHDSISLEIDKFLERVQDEVCYDYWLKSFFDYYNSSTQMGMEGVMVHLAEKYIVNSDLVDGITSEQITFLKSEISFLKPNLLGKQAPELLLKDTLLSDTNPLALKDKYLVLFFYDPDCEHCREKTDLMNESYADIRLAGAELVSVCVSTDIEQWRKYMAYKKMEDWVNLADPYYTSDFRKKYNVRGVPKIYVLDENRRIIGKDLDASQLVSFLQTL